MNKKIIKKLASLSYTKENLDESKVKKISSSLNRIQLKDYIKSLKDLEKRKNVFVFLPEALKDKKLENSIRDKFPKKRISLIIDKNLIAGIKIVDYDNIYDFSLNNKLKNIVSFVK